MGLSGRKVKQRIQADPRNLTWADDASKFGASYLAKFGWNSSQGLGVAGEGRTSHLKVSQKLDMLGIGAAQSKDPNGLAWKQSKDFESLLRRLNENTATTVTEDEKRDEDVEMEASGENIEESEEKEKKEKKKEKKKREREENEKESREEKKERKKRKRDESAEDSKQGKEKKRKKSKDKTEDKEDVQETNTSVVAEVKVEAVVQPKRPVIPRHKAHRARLIAAKNIASKSAASISEILGIASTPSSSVATTTAPTPSGSLTPLDDDIGLEKLTTSTKSVTDYFKERLLAKTSGKSTPTVPSPLNDSRDEEDAPRAGLGSSRRQMDLDEDDAPRGGIGSRNTLAAAGSSSLGSTLMQMSKFASMFTSATVIPSTGDDEQDKPIAHSDEQDGDEAREKKSKDRKRRKEKAEKEKTEQDEDDKAERKRAKEERKREKAEKKKRKSEVSD